LLTFFFEKFGDENVFLNNCCVKAINDLLLKKSISIENNAIGMISVARGFKSSCPL
jgi:hypothetical protein